MKKLGETVVDGEPALDVGTEEEFDRALSSGVWVMAPTTAGAESWLPWDEDNTDLLEEELVASDPDPTQEDASDQPGWLIRRLWSWVRGLAPALNESVITDSITVL